MIEFQLTPDSSLPILVMLVIAAAMSLVLCFFFLWQLRSSRTNSGRIFGGCLATISVLTSLQVLVWHMYFHNADHRRIEFTGIIAAWVLGFTVWAIVYRIHTRMQHAPSRLLASRIMTGSLTMAAALYVLGFSAAANHYSVPVETPDKYLFTQNFTLESATAIARTDRGTIIPLSTRVKDDASIAAIHEALESQVYGLASRAMFRDAGSPDANCHGWVFTGGRYIVHGSDVQTILNDNGYERVSEPAIGDVVVYCNTSGDVVHTAIVRGFLNDGAVVVEGKWGANGVYMHIVEEQHYGVNFTFHRSQRSSHLLHIEQEDTVSRPLSTDAFDSVPK